MKFKSMRERLLASSMICGAALLGFASQAAAQEEIAEVVVTGSRIPQPNLESVSPVTAIGSAEIKAQGVTRVEDIINTLPQAFAAQGSTISNGSNGTATVNLRGLGASRTLVLIDGRRLGPGNPTSTGSPVADLNFIPAALVERVDVLTGGASAVYGADAVAGVVNFIMQKNFEGVKVDANYSIYQHDNSNPVADVVAARKLTAGANASQFNLPKKNVRDGEASEVTLVLGVNAEDGKGNITAYASYIQQNPILQGNRDYSTCTLNSGAAFTCGGSGTANPARVGGFTVQGNTFRTRNATTDVYNFGPTNYYIRPDERYSLGAFAHYELAEWAEAYADVMFMDDRSVAQIAPGGVFAQTFSINCDNAFMTAAQQTQLCGANAGSATALFTGTVARRNVEGGGRQSDFRHESYRYVVGLRGQLNDAWNYDSYLEYSSTKFDARQTAYFLTSRINNALIAKRLPNGQIVCGVNADSITTNNDSACVPYNLFQEGAVTKAMLDYLQVPASTFGNTSERVASFSLAGDLSGYGVKTPWANDGVGVAFGAEYRREHVDFNGDFVSVTPGQLNGGGAASTPIGASFDVYEAFGEARIPVIQDMPFAKSVQLEVGYRYSDYSYDVTTDTYKLAGDWEPVDGLRLRASYQRAVRAPNLVELFGPQIHALDGSTDPCAGLTATSALLARCAAVHNYTTAQVLTIEKNPANQYYGLVGGNANLVPETSDTYSVGAVYEPSFLAGSNFTVDYFDIRVDDYISGIGADTILRKCYNEGDNSYCGLIIRDPATKSLFLNSSGPEGHVIDTTQNTGSLRTKGWDFSASYRTDLDTFGLENAGGISATFVGTYLTELSSAILKGDPFVDCAGLYGAQCAGRPGSGVPNPKWRSKARLNWNMPYEFGPVSKAALSVQWRHLSKVKLDTTNSDPLLNDPDSQPATDLKLKSQNYFDLLASFKAYDRVSFRLGVNNVFDKDPPLVGQSNCPSGFCNGNTYSQVYDALGRYLFVGLTADF